MARNEVSSQLGQLLLRGWRMMAESCSDCAVPYMRNPNTGEQLCVGCKQSPPSATVPDAPVSTSAGTKPAADTDIATAAALQPPTPSPRAPIGSRQLPAAPGLVGSHNSSSPGSQDRPGTSTGDEASKGPAHTQQQAPDPSQEAAPSAAAAAAAAAHDAAPRPPAATVALPPRQPPPAGRPKPAPPLQDAAAAVQGATLGQLLLRGWIMAAEGCPTCQVPYMCHPRTKQRVCVSCVNANTASSSTRKSSAQPTAVLNPAGGSTQPTAAAAGAAPAAAAGAVATPPTAADSTAGPVHTTAQPPQAVPAVTGVMPYSSRSSSSRVEVSGPDVAGLLQQKLVEGWVLLDHTCPLCETWLVRERSTRKMWCVKCDLPVQMAPVVEVQQQEGR